MIKAMSHTKIAARKPVSWRELIITQHNIHPRQGIQPTNAQYSAVTKTELK